LLYFCCMERAELVRNLVALGEIMAQVGQGKSIHSRHFSQQIAEQLEETVRTEVAKNGWFNESNVRCAFFEASAWLTEVKLTRFIEGQPFYKFRKGLGLILAGNVPLVGFHDFLCGLMMGCRLKIKMSSDDNRLLPILVKALRELNRDFENIVDLNPLKLTEYDAIIGTGTNTALLHFRSFFKEVPHLLRGNRTSIAVLTGNESDQDLEDLGKDIFLYFGRGCRNVTHLVVPKDYSMEGFFRSILPFEDVLQNKKYGNNYEYHRAIFLLSQQSLLDNGFILLKESSELHPPLAMLYFHTYTDRSEVDTYLKNHEDQIQCIIGKDYSPFGSAQKPNLNDFADNRNTLNWLTRVLN